LAQALAACAPSSEVLTVVAAASLTDALGALEAPFEATHAGVDLQLAFAGSQAGATWIRQGLDAGAYASADASHVDALVSEGLLHDPRPFASNGLVVATPAGAPALTSLAELSTCDRIVLGTPEVPVGRYAEMFLDAATTELGADWRAAVDARVVSREGSVRLVRSKVVLGEADAAVVYASDLFGHDDLGRLAVPPALTPEVALHHGRIGGPDTRAEEWLSFVEGRVGHEVLARHGFGPAPGRP